MDCRNTTTGEIKHVEYAVPGTETTVHMRFRQDRPLLRKSLGGFLLLIQDEFLAHINAFGDGRLLPQDDPYLRNWPGSFFERLRSISWLISVYAEGFYFLAKSSARLPGSEGGAHLTYGILDDAVKGEIFSYALSSDY